MSVLSVIYKIRQILTFDLMSTCLHIHSNSSLASLHRICLVGIEWIFYTKTTYHGKQRNHTAWCNTISWYSFHCSFSLWHIFLNSLFVLYLLILSLKFADLGIVFLQCLSRALRNENPKLLMAASAVFLPIQPLMVSAVHTGMMEVTWYIFTAVFLQVYDFHLPSFILCIKLFCCFRNHGHSKGLVTQLSSVSS